MLGRISCTCRMSSGGVEVRGDTRALHLNETIEVVGYPTLVGRYSPVMTDAVFRAVQRESARFV